ncbi:hypothetical protein Ancab_021702 [Ancistrocladus abbreviatus]
MVSIPENSSLVEHETHKGDSMFQMFQDVFGLIGEHVDMDIDRRRQYSGWLGEGVWVWELFVCIAWLTSLAFMQGEMTMSDEMDLLVEQVKMLARDIAFSTSTLKHLLEQSVNDLDALKTQIQNLEREIQEKRRQMRILEQRIIQSGEASISNASLVDMQQVVGRLYCVYHVLFILPTPPIIIAFRHFNFRYPAFQGVYNILFSFKQHPLPFESPNPSPVAPFSLIIDVSILIKCNIV